MKSSFSYCRKINLVIKFKFLLKVNSAMKIYKKYLFKNFNLSTNFNLNILRYKPVIMEKKEETE